jgi:hypothetical protein
LLREILSGGPIITADPFCRVKISLLPRKIYFLHVLHGPLLDLYFRAPILYRRSIFSVLFIAASFCAICLFIAFIFLRLPLPRNILPLGAFLHPFSFAA